MTPPRRAKLVLLVLAVAFVGLGVLASQPVYWWVMTKRQYYEIFYMGGRERGYQAVWRWGRQPGVAHGWGRSYNVDSGVLRGESYHENGLLLRETSWFHDGEVIHQLDEAKSRWAPPWWWGVTDQTEPTMPAWMKDDEKWQAALAAQE